MADDDDFEPEDDGWGNVSSAEDLAAPSDKAGQTGTPEAATERIAAKATDDHGGEWVDPAKIEERVAALKEKRSQPAVAHAPVTPPPPVESEPSLADDGTVVVDEDAPAWSDEIEAEVSATSDMLAAAGVVASRDQERGKTTKKKDRKAPRRTGNASENGHGRRKLSNRQLSFLIGGTALALVLAVCAVLGYFNSQNYYLSCHPSYVAAEKGRFWPWGQDRLAGPEFAPISVPAEFACVDTQASSLGELEELFLRTLLERTSSILSQRESELVAEAQKQLEQALLLTRSPDRKESRVLALRLQGDVNYLKAMAEMTAAAARVKLAAELFEEAASQRPRHASDAHPRAEHARFLAGEIEAGVPAAPTDDVTKADRPMPEPSRPDDSADVLSPFDDPARTSPAPPEVRDSPKADEAPADAGPPNQAAPADASVPTGGVLL